MNIQSLIWTMNTFTNQNGCYTKWHPLTLACTLLHDLRVVIILWLLVRALTPQKECKITYSWWENELRRFSHLFRKSCIYTVLHIFRQVLFGAGNQGNHQNFDLSLLSYKCWLIFIGMKQKKLAGKNLLFWVGHFASSPRKSFDSFRLARKGQNFDDYPGFQSEIAYSN